MPASIPAKVITAAHPALDCTVVERSGRGVRLRFDGEPPVGDNLLLILEQPGEVRSVAVRWRKEHLIGAEFVTEGDTLL